MKFDTKISFHKITLTFCGFAAQKKKWWMAALNTNGSTTLTTLCVCVIIITHMRYNICTYCSSSIVLNAATRLLPFFLFSVPVFLDCNNVTSPGCCCCYQGKITIRYIENHLIIAGNNLKNIFQSCLDLILTFELKVVESKLFYFSIQVYNSSKLRF